MRTLILLIFEGLLYLQVIGMTVSGVIWGRNAAPQLQPYADMTPDAAALVGGIGGFLFGVLLSGYGIALLSINGELRRLNRS